ncbi:GNAT family N-acetyltransferase [Halopiger xanaduensis]|uniref:GCN5-related N-acetyltransferase n=1 Tax=Halopiger xanaduensis (strain DSM 18323 / JCM 14033 / SH-6) TaxID=797210 RepID=F8D3B4_HALXS|nr:GNAT family N-acetyltransferase [Halopiger xanaduensis]AEH38549.1 GCN5-related N-acetyltransferase [Halopiger xanaduensis SH-6]
MEIRPLPADEAAVRRYVEELWLPYHRELEATVETHDLAEDVDLVAEEVSFRRERLEDEDYRLWVAVDEIDRDAAASDDVGLARDGTLAGFVGTEIDAAPSVFDRPDRLVIGDIFVREPYRGTGLARDLIDRAAARARDGGCAELALEVGADNERALAFYEKVGFEPFRHRMRIDLGDL